MKGTKGSAGAGAAGLLSTVLSLVISKYQTHAGTSGNLSESDIRPGTASHVYNHLNCLGNSQLLNVHSITMSCHAVTEHFIRNALLIG